MGFFSFNQEIAIDLGTANTIILYNDKIVVDAPSMVALDNRTGKLKAVGHEAQAMYGRAPENIRVIRPLQNGVIADFNAAEQMMRGMMKMVSMRNTLFSSSLRMWCVSRREVPRWRYVPCATRQSMWVAGTYI